MIPIDVTVNGQRYESEVAAETLLVEYLRNTLRLTGTRVGCETSQCGACTVHVDGAAIKSCTMLAVQADGTRVDTIEGVALPGQPLHPMQEAFRTHHGLQCGFCTSGMVMIALDIARRLRRPTEQEIREELKGNLCRCTGYHNIVLAIASGTKAMSTERPGDGA